MKQWTIGKRITVGFGTIIALVVGLSTFNITKLVLIRENTSAVVEKSMPRSYVADNIQFRITDILLDTYKLISSTNAQDIAQLDASIKANLEANTKGFEDYKQLSAQEPKKMEHYNQALEIRSKYRAKLQEILEEGRKTTNAEQVAHAYARSRNELDPIINEMVLYMEKVSNEESEEATKSGHSTNQVIANSITIILFGSIGAILFISLLSYFIISRVNRSLRQISSSINDSALQVSSASAQVASSSQSLAEGSSEQAASIEETSSSLEEMSSMTRQNADNSQKTNQ
jgi:methyl-accepting chemotaxis protein